MDTHTARSSIWTSSWASAGDDGAPAGIGGMVDYRTDLFDAASIERWWGGSVGWSWCGGRFVGDGGRVALLDAGERARLDRWSGADVSAPVAVGSGALAAAVARSRTGWPCHGVLSWSYRELDENSNRLARVLIGPGWSGTVCGVAIERCAELVWRGGGAQDWGGLPADRPGAAGGADRIHGGRCLCRSSPSTIAGAVPSGLRVDGLAVGRRGGSDHRCRARWRHWVSMTRRI